MITAILGIILAIYIWRHPSKFDAWKWPWGNNN